MNRNFSVLMLVTLLAAFTTACAPQGDPNHRGFASADSAVAALIAAMESNNVAEMQKLFGPDSDDLINSGDAVADARDRQTFVTAYKEKHELVQEQDGRTVLVIGPNQWPMPVPLVQVEGQWRFDGAEGVDEIVYRRVGRNELGAIQVCRGFVDAQEEYAANPHDGNPAGFYAVHLISDAGMENGLYWPTAEGEETSPAGPFVAAAAGEGYRRAAQGQRLPYHGYYYRLLYAQGPSAQGGAREYFDEGHLVNGFALIAWPAEYGVSGVKTFMVSQDGVVFEKDLGEGTADAADAIEVFDPDSTWSPVAAPSDVST